MDLRSYSAGEKLKDGTPVIVRAIRANDQASLRAEFGKLDSESIYLRFFAFKRGLTDSELSEATNVDFDHVVALVATTGTGEHERLIGGGRYIVGHGAPTSAELAFLTNGEFRGQGLASLILRHLIAIGRTAGIERFEADVLAQNHPMLSVFRASGLPITTRWDGGTVHIVLTLEPPC